MSKNYKVVLYTIDGCVPCDEVGSYPSEQTTLKGYAYEAIHLTSKTDGKSPYGIQAFPWFALQDLDISTNPITNISGSSIVDSYYGSGDQSRFDILINR